MIEYCLDPRAAVWSVLPSVRGVRQQVPDVGAGRDHHQVPEFEALARLLPSSRDRGQPKQRDEKGEGEKREREREGTRQ